MSESSFTLGALADRVRGKVVGDAGVEIRGLGTLATAKHGEITHLSSASYRQYLADSKASAIILRPIDVSKWTGNALVVANPYLAFASISQLFARLPGLDPGVDATARVHESARLDPSVVVGPHVTIGADTTIGPGVRFYANVVVGERCRIDTDAILMANVVLYGDVALGPRAIVHSGSVIGADGFGFAVDEQDRLQPIAQLGGVKVGADVSIGANTTIDRGTIGDTIIDDGVKIDNQVQIGHNCRIGAHTIICGCVGIAGSVTIGRHCVLSGGSGAGGNGPIELADRVTLTAATIVVSSISEPGIYSGLVLHNSNTKWKRNALRLQRLDELNRRVRALEKLARFDSDS